MCSGTEGKIGRFISVMTFVVRGIIHFVELENNHKTHCAGVIACSNQASIPDRALNATIEIVDLRGTLI
jgi:hypothetical protein